MAAADTGDTRLAETEQKLGQLQTDLSIVARKVETRIELGAGPMAGAAAPAGAAPMRYDPEQLAGLRADVDAALRAVSKLNADQETADARSNARFERLELRTSELTWPDDNAALGLHLASYRTHESALAGWEVLRTEFPDLFNGQDPLFVEVETVAGLFVRLMIGVGRDERWLVRVRDQVRADGEYAMIMPVPSGQAPEMPNKTKLPAPPKILIPGS